MAYQNLFEAIINVTGFTPLESDMFEIISAYEKDLAESKREPESELDKRKSKFALDINAKKGSYENSMLRDFFFYWSEHSDKGRKMRFEKEKVFDVKLRLARWHKNSKANGKHKNNGHSISESTNLAQRILRGELS